MTQEVVWPTITDMNEDYDSFDALVEPWDVDPLGTTRHLLSLAARGIAPTFFSSYENNTYLLAKYVNFLLCESTYFPPFAGPNPWFPRGEPTFHRLVRIEKVLRWVKGAVCPRVGKSSRIPRNGDQTSPDDYLAEAIVAFIISSSTGIPADCLQFLKARIGHRTPEFTVRGTGWSAVVEVKHILKTPQGAQEALWLQKCGHGTDLAKVRPYDALTARIAQACNSKQVHGPCLAELPWQKSKDSVAQLLTTADKQLRTCTADHGKECKIIVLYSDEPHGFTRKEAKGASEKPSENRIETAIRDFVNKPAQRNADAIVVLGHPRGLPISNGHCFKAYGVRSRWIPVLVKRMFGCLQLLEKSDIRPAVLLPQQEPKRRRRKRARH